MTVLTIFFYFLLGFYLWFLYKIYRGLKNLKDVPGRIPAGFVSVIIPFRNESENILMNLRSIEAQDYTSEKFEVLYINDASGDESRRILEENISVQNIKIMDLPSQYSGKKSAVNYGIQKSMGEIIVTTDADCTHDKSWLRNLLKYFDDRTAMVAGAVEINPAITFFQKLQQLEFAGIITAGAGLIGARSPVTCNAANLAYRKKIFDELKGFAGNIHIASGDDEFLMQKINSATDYKIKFCADRNAVVKTKPCSSLRQFLNQRKRWGSKGLYYRPQIRITLILVFLFYTGLIIQAVLSFFLSMVLVSMLISFFFKIISEYLVLKKGNDLFFRKRFFKYFFVTELFQISYIIAAPVLGIFSRYKWKERWF